MAKYPAGRHWTMISLMTPGAVTSAALPREVLRTIDPPTRTTSVRGRNKLLITTARRCPLR
ncbi:hypothetical protein [Actinopolyspora erythraea]|uniref:hypothetical protein n=1 Tax=Actinopolyspora erythraea TaxID=414996 RepID=UPI001184BE9E|nr:hypothetical protein [Actinopolyspora erythraea]